MIKKAGESNNCLIMLKPCFRIVTKTIITAIQSHNTELVKYLVSLTSETRFKTLITAIQSGYIEVVNYLYEHGSDKDINAKDKYY